MRRCSVQRILEMHSKQWKILPKATSNKEPGDIRFGEQPIGITILSKYLKSMCTEAKINMEGRRFKNHSGKRDYFKREILTNRQLCQELVTAQLSAPTNGQAAAKVKAVSDALQPPSGELEEPEGKMKTIEGQDRNEPKPELSAKTSLVIKHGDTSVTFKFE